MEEFSDFAEEDLAGLAGALGFSYELDGTSAASRAAQRTGPVYASAWVKFRRPGSKRYVSFSGPAMDGPTGHACSHLKRFSSATYGATLDEAMAVARRDACMVACARILSGCVARVSGNGRVRVPPAASIAELRMKLAVSDESAVRAGPLEDLRRMVAELQRLRPADGFRLEVYRISNTWWVAEVMRADGDDPGAPRVAVLSRRAVTAETAALGVLEAWRDGVAEPEVPAAASPEELRLKAAVKGCEAAR